MWYAIIDGEISKPQKAKKLAVALIEKHYGEAKYSGRDGEAYTYNNEHYVIHDLKEAQKLQKRLNKSLLSAEKEITESVPQMPFEDELKQLVDRVINTHSTDAEAAMGGQYAKGVTAGYREMAQAVRKILEKHDI